MADFLQPEAIIKRLEVKSGMHVADFGAGSGFFTIPLAKIVGDTGKVTALDIQKEALEVIRSHARAENLLNIDMVWANLELPRGAKLENDTQDMVFVSNALFQADDKPAILREAFRILKLGGVLIIFEWDEEDPPPGPPRELRVPKHIMKDSAERLGFKLYRDLEAGSHHYGLLFKK